MILVIVNLQVGEIIHGYLFPVLDFGSGNTFKDSQKQVKNIERYYGELILAFQQNLKENPVMTLRELDKIWFIIPIENELSDLQ